MKLPGRYKGTHVRREPPVVVECACGWRSCPLNPKKAEKRYAAHVAVRHAGQNSEASAEGFGKPLRSDGGDVLRVRGLLQ